MELPVETEKLSIIVIGEALPVYVYGTNELRKNSKGQSIFKVPVLIQNTGDRQDPTTTISIAGEKPNFPKGSRISPVGLTVMSWNLRGKDGVIRNGITLRAKSLNLYGNK
mgnify:CR=1 FL=1|jgi:hypothetical protein